ncbi:phage holin family protein [Campylobacter coli]|uniref:phage holin family protein n=1 Tax=Campylobacter coli TaxID=195 RepID=UPI003B981DCD
MKLEDIFVYMVLMIVSFIAGLVGIVTKNKLSKALNLKGKFTLFLKGMLGSMFVAYLVFEIVNYLNFGIKLSVAVGGFGAYMGTDALLKIEQLVEKLINKKMEKL